MKTNWFNPSVSTVMVDISHCSNSQLNKQPALEKNYNVKVTIKQSYTLMAGCRCARCTDTTQCRCVSVCLPAAVLICHQYDGGGELFLFLKRKERKEERKKRVWRKANKQQQTSDLWPPAHCSECTVMIQFMRGRVLISVMWPSLIRTEGWFGAAELPLPRRADPVSQNRVTDLWPQGPEISRSFRGLFSLAAVGVCIITAN